LALKSLRLSHDVLAPPTHGGVPIDLFVLWIRDMVFRRVMKQQQEAKIRHLAPQDAMQACNGWL